VVENHTEVFLHAIEAGDVEFVTFGEGGFIEAFETGEFVSLKGVGLNHPLEGSAKARLIEAWGLKVLKGVGLSDGSLGKALYEFFAGVLVLFSVDEDTDDKNGGDTPEICGAGVVVGHDDQGPEGGDGEPRV
jgi:hypothetical protein